MNTALSHLRAFSLLAAWVLFGSVAAYATDYKFTSVSRAGMTHTNFTDINNAGLIVGVSGVGIASTGFIYNRGTGTFSDLAGPPGAVSTVPLGVSDTGAVVGYSTDAGSVFHPFIYEGGIYKDFAISGADTTNLSGISPDARYLTGTYLTASVVHGYIFDRNTATVFEVALGATVSGINSHGIAVGVTLGQVRTSFLYDLATGLRTDYEPTGDRYRAINDAGIVAGYRSVLGRQVGIVGPAGNLAVLDFPFAGLGEIAYGNNNAGAVIGYYSPDTLSSNSFIATPVPEPHAAALLIAGIVGLVALRRRSFC